MCRFHGRPAITTAATLTLGFATGPMAVAEQRAGAEVYAYFNDDVGGHAPRNALTLRMMMEDSNE